MILLGVGALLAVAPKQAFAAEMVLNQSEQNGIPYVQGADNKAWPSIISQAAVVMDMNTGTIIYGKHPLTSHYPASITKIMTAMLALQHGHLDDVLTASANAVKQPPDKLYMVVGEKEKLEPLLYGLLLDSANDAAVEIAEHYGGSVANFAKMMNAEAKALGATHTHFVNPNGLPNPHHVTTAYDMALIARAAMQYPEFRKIVRTKYYNWSGKEWHAKLSNLNGMLFYYPGCIGLKTGFTSVAHETLVVAAKRGSNTFLAVLMDTPTDYEIRHDASQLLNYAFAHYQTQTIVKKGQVVGDVPGQAAGAAIPLLAEKTVEATVPKGQPMNYQTNLSYALPAHTVPAGGTVATLTFSSPEGQDLDVIPVGVSKNFVPNFKRNSVHPGPVLTPLIILCSILSLMVSIVRMRRRRRRDLAVRGPVRRSPMYYHRD